MKSIEKYYKNNVERIREIKYYFNVLDDLTKTGKIKVLEVGFAGSWYLEDIINDYGDKVEYTGLDGDMGRILGTTLKVEEARRNSWKNYLNDIKYIHGDIITHKSDEKYDLISSISTIEHIVPLAYENKSAFDTHLDIKAIESMKDMLNEGGKLLLTFPCGEERLFFNPQNPNKVVLKENGFIESRHSLIIYDEDRINKIIGDYKVLDKSYWSLKETESVEDAAALTYKHNSSFVKSLCTLLIEKP